MRVFLGKHIQSNNHKVDGPEIQDETVSTDEADADEATFSDEDEDEVSNSMTIYIMYVCPYTSRAVFTLVLKLPGRVNNVIGHFSSLW